MMIHEDIIRKVLWNSELYIYDPDLGRYTEIDSLKVNRLMNTMKRRSQGSEFLEDLIRKTYVEEGDENEFFF